MSARLFAALELPADVRAGLAAFGREAAARDRALRPVARGRPAPDARLPRPSRARRDRPRARGRARRGRLAGAGADPRRPAVAVAAPAARPHGGAGGRRRRARRAAGHRRRAPGRRPAVAARGPAVPGRTSPWRGCAANGARGSTTCPRPHRRPSPPTRWCSSARTWAARPGALRAARARGAGGWRPDAAARAHSARRRSPSRSGGIEFAAARGAARRASRERSALRRELA